MWWHVPCIRLPMWTRRLTQIGHSNGGQEFKTRAQIGREWKWKMRLLQDQIRLSSRHVVWEAEIRIFLTASNRSEASCIRCGGAISVSMTRRQMDFFLLRPHIPLIPQMRVLPTVLTFIEKLFAFQSAIDLCDSARTECTCFIDCFFKSASHWNNFGAC